VRRRRRRRSRIRRRRGKRRRGRRGRRRPEGTSVFWQSFVACLRASKQNNRDGGKQTGIAVSGVF